MNGISVADGLRPDSDRLGGGLGGAIPRVVAALVQHESMVEGIPVSVMIERPEVDRAGGAWRCRIRVLRGTGRREQSQVVGTSSRAVLQEAVELAAARLGISGSELLGGASVGLAS